MIDTIYRTYETQGDFRALFDKQECFCLPHFERLIGGIDKKKMKRYGSEMSKSLTRITKDYSKKLYDDISEYCTIYDYRSSKEKKSRDCLESVEKTVAFLNGRYY